MEKDREESFYRVGGVERDRDSRETKLNVPFSILVRSMGTRAGTTSIQLMIRVELHKLISAAMFSLHVFWLAKMPH